MHKNLIRSLVIVSLLVMVVAIGVAAQAPQGGGAGGGAQGGAPGGGAGRGGQRGPALNVTSSAWPDGGEVPQKYAGRGGNTSPAFEFNWMQGTNPAMPPANLASYLIIFHDIENAPRGGEPDTLHWMIWDIPGTAKGLPEGLPMGDLPDGSRQSTTNVGRGSYFGPGAGVGPFHHYVFEFYALDTKLNLPATSTRAQVFAAIEGHVVGKSAFVGRFHATQ
jgi:Raf kinase inhibitor-like YbhB/YbcL family protein